MEPEKKKELSESDIWFSLLFSPVIILRFLGVCAAKLTAISNEIKNGLHKGN